jgi:hypothetical protein
MLGDESIAELLIATETLHDLQVMQLVPRFGEVHLYVVTFPEPAESFCIATMGG